MRKTAALLLALLMLCGCAAKEAPPAAADPSPSQAASQEPIELSADTVIMEVEGEPVLWPEFNYYLNYIIEFYYSAHTSQPLPWQTEEEMTQYYLNYAVSIAKNHRALEEKAQELDAGLTQAQVEEIEQIITEGETVYGSGEYRRMVEDAYNTMDNFRYLMAVGSLTDNVFAALYGENGAALSDEDALAFAEEEGYMCVKFICVSQNDENAALMEELSLRLSQSQEPDELFDRLMDEYSEYTVLNSAAFQQGMLFGKGYLGEAFDNAYSLLSDGEISPVSRGPNELYLIQRLPLIPDGSKNEGGFTLRHCAAYALFQQDMDAWGEALSHSLRDGYYAIDFEGPETP